jgi:hypothetical protein
MRYLLDTNIVSDLVRRPQGRIAEHIRKVGEAQVCTSVIVAAELRYGAAKTVGFAPGSSRPANRSAPTTCLSPLTPSRLAAPSLLTMNRSSGASSGSLAKIGYVRSDALGAPRKREEAVQMPPLYRK